MALVVTSKTCQACLVEKQNSEFSRMRASRDGLQPKCKPCSSAAYRAWRIANPEKNARLTREWQERNRAQHRASVRRWQRENPEQNRLRGLRSTLAYKARKIGATIGEVDLQAVLDRDGSTCYLCGDDVRRDDLQFDHVVPLSRGGEHSNSNLRVAHALCNKRKANKMIEELTWL